LRVLRAKESGTSACLLVEETVGIDAGVGLAEFAQT
jgi:hypothetical protein